jgi:hypothetical protein
MSLFFTSSQDWRKARRVNSTNSGGFPSRAFTKTKPRAGLALDAGAAVMEVVPTRGETNAFAGNLLRVKPFAVADDDGTFSFRAYGWGAVNPPSNDPNANGYDPQLLFEAACVACSATGLAGTQVSDTERFCDAITLVTGDTSLVKIVSPGSNTPAFLVFDFLGFPDVELVFNVTANVTSMNALVAGL